jgi:hypothetical protein
MGITLDNLDGQSNPGDTSLPLDTGTGHDLGSSRNTGRGKRGNGNRSRKAAASEAEVSAGSSEGETQAVDGDTFQVGDQHISGKGKRSESKGRGPSKRNLTKAALLKSASDDADQIITIVNMSVGSTIGAEAMVTEDDREYQMIKPSLAQMIADTPGYDKIADKKGPLVLLAGSVMWAFKAYMVYLVKNDRQPFWVTMRVPRKERKPHVENMAGTADFVPAQPATNGRVRYEPAHPETYIPPEFIPFDAATNGPDPDTMDGLSGFGAPMDMGFGSPITGGSGG